MIYKISKAMILTLALGAASFGLLRATGAQTQKRSDETRSTMRWEHSDDGLKFRVEIQGKAEFNEDYTDIRDVSDGGYVRIEEDRNVQSRRYEVRRNAEQLKRIYYVNGEAHPIDQDARSWLARIVLDCVRQSGIDADKRVVTILRQHGVSGVLDEIGLIKGDYARGIYFKALIKNGDLNGAALQQVLREAARQISSDYEQAKLLVAVAPMLVGKEEAMPAFFEATATIKSDYERKNVLTGLLKNNTASREVLVQTAKSASSMTSDYEKANVLKAIAKAYLDDRELRTVFFQTVETMKSDYEHHGVLSALLKNSKLDEEVLSGMINSASRMTSDYEKASFLMEASYAYAGDSRFRESFLKAVETIKSDHERGRVLSALMKNKQIG
jgi:predicted hydrolase (HD superfamily)